MTYEDLYQRLIAKGIEADQSKYENLFNFLDQARFFPSFSLGPL